MRKQKKLTQEQLAEKMGVSRQTISKWESDEIVPELGKLISLSELFSCNLDALIKDDLADRSGIYSEVTFKHLNAFKMARYVMITPNPEDDVNRYMKGWAQMSGRLEADPDAKLIGWDFPFVPPELHIRFGLHGYVAAYILPDGFENLSSQAYAHVFSANFAADCVKNACRATARLHIFALSATKLCSKIRTHIL